ncbi:Destabilase [Popillia japonica]|uniref:lysozyme n=1 Tax=Popillia japonica TaxID=7064 RepID=A0AAW1HG74_POPJA
MCYNVLHEELKVKGDKIIELEEQNASQQTQLKKFEEELAQLRTENREVTAKDKKRYIKRLSLMRNAKLIEPEVKKESNDDVFSDIKEEYQKLEKKLNEVDNLSVKGRLERAEEIKKCLQIMRKIFHAHRKEQTASCNVTSNCQGEVCGPFRITWPYWADAGKPTVKNESPDSATAYKNCALDTFCAALAVQGYMQKYQQDCNNDGKIDCDDYAAIHKLGGYGCQGQLPYEYAQRYQQCKKIVGGLGK